MLAITGGIFVAAMAVLSGCETIQYRVGAKTFYDKAEALQEADREFAGYLASIPPTQSPVGGAALVVVPTSDIIQQRGVQISGAPTPRQFREMSDFQTQGVIKMLDYYYRAIEKRHIFDRVSLDRSPEPREASLAADYDYLIFFDLVSWQHSQWYARAKGWSKPHSIYMDTSRPEGPGRTIAWLDSLEEQVRK